MDSTFLIIGAGPAGLQVAYFLEQVKRAYQVKQGLGSGTRSGSINKDDNRNPFNYLILERAEKAGSFFRQYPITRKLISINKCYIDYDEGTDPKEIGLRHDWNSLLSENGPRVSDFTKDYFPDAGVFADYLESYAVSQDLQIRYQTQVTKIERKGNGHFSVMTKRTASEPNISTEEEYTCQHLIVCTGVSAPHIPKVPGIEHAIGYEELANYPPESFTNQRVCLIGSGNSAMETAKSLTPYTKYTAVLSRDPPKFSWNTHYVGNIRAINSDFLDTFQLKSGNFMQSSLDSVIEERNGQYYIKSISVDYPYDKVIRCTGFQFDSSIFDEEVRPELTKEDRFPKINWEFESTNIKNLYFLGTISQSLDYKMGTLGFIHGFRYSAKFFVNLLQLRLGETTELPSKMIAKSGDLEGLSSYITREFSENSGIWQGFRFWCTVIEVKSDGFYAYQTLPVEWVKTSGYFQDKTIFLMTHEYGFEPGDDAWERFTTYQEFGGFLSKFIHPVIRYYPKNQWSLEEHVQCLCGSWSPYKQMRVFAQCQRCCQTVICGDCRKYVTLQELEPHQKVNHNQSNETAILDKILDASETTEQIPMKMGQPIQHVAVIDQNHAYALHLMEDLQGRYYSTSRSGEVKPRLDLQIVYRYLQALLGSLMVPQKPQGLAYDMRAPVYIKKFQLTQSSSDLFYQLGLFLNACLITIDTKNGQIHVRISEHDRRVIDTNPKKSQYLNNYLKQLGQILKIAKIQIQDIE